LAGAVALAGWASGVLQPFENQTWSWRVRLLAVPGPATERIRIVTLDQASLDWGRTENGLGWPWPRESYAYLLDFLARAKPRTIAFDVLFSEPSVYGVEDDQRLAARIKESGNVVLVQKATEAEGGLIPELAAGAAGLAHVGETPDQDGIFRRLVLRHGDGRSSLALATLLAQPGQAAPAVMVDHPYLLRYRGPAATFPTWSLAAIIRSELLLRQGKQPEIDPEQFRDSIVFLGFSAPGLLDLRAAPTDPVMPGVEIHATALSNLMAGDFLAEVGWPTVGLTTLFFGLLTGVVIVLANRPLRSLALFAGLTPLPLAAGFAAYGLGFWLPVLPPTVALMIAATFAFLWNQATEGRQRSYLKKVFGQYLHPSVIEQLLADPRQLSLGGQKRELTVFFSDLQGFTSISERLTPEQLTALLNDYLSEMSEIILAEEGTIDKYEGDAIIAFWNAPLDQLDHASRAVRAAVRCQQRLAELRPRYREHYGADLCMRIGINTGQAVVGNMGSARRFNYTVLGDAVNLAARLEGVNKQFATTILLTEATAQQADSPVPLVEIATV
ncbi:MAG TPA: adenylate/guanylate cyclase domain-containing protein, partial [Desulfurivibrionaceae bacterium]|nr:adenylate/guanylate cyclase domain-containing protein [Desulfurivibrionaceae bacterium]